MNLKFVETFVWAARLGSFKKTADRLHTTLAAVSSRILTLEAEFGVELFVREGRNLRLSDKGRDLLPLAERLLHAAAEFEGRIRSESSFVGRMRLGVIDTAANVLLSPLLKEAQRRMPQVEIDLVADTSQRIVERMQEGEIDLGISLNVPGVPSLRSRPLLNLACAWMAAPSLVPAPRTLTLEELATFPVLTFAPGSIPHEQTRALFAPFGGPRRLHSGTSLATMLRLARDGLGVLVMPLALVQDDLDAGRLRLVCPQLAFPPLEIQVGWIDGPDSLLRTALAQMAVDVAQAYCATTPAERAWRPVEDRSNFS